MGIDLSESVMLSDTSYFSEQGWIQDLSGGDPGLKVGQGQTKAYFHPPGANSVMNRSLYGELC